MSILSADAHAAASALTQSSPAEIEPGLPSAKAQGPDWVLMAQPGIAGAPVLLARSADYLAASAIAFTPAQPGGPSARSPPNR